MLSIQDLRFTLAGKPIFTGASATIPAGHKVGVVGRNGAGKSTLFGLIEGRLTPDGGRIEVPRGARIGGVAQEAPGGPEPLLDIVLAADTERAALLAEAEPAEDPARIAEIQTRLADIQAHSAEARAAGILHGLGFDAAGQARPASDFSGGWRMRVALGAALLAAPDFLMLDEPTNYLDLEGSVWLESYLARYPYTALVISHDRGLLNRAVGAILHLKDGKLDLSTGGYDAFAKLRQARAEAAAAEARKVEAQRAHLQSFVDRFRYKESKAKQAQSRIKMIERLADIAVPEAERAKPFQFPEPEPLSPPILRLEGVAVGYGGPPILSRLSLRIDPDDRIALLGANGQGKSTFAKLIAGRLAPEAGEVVRSSKLRIGFFAQHQLEELVATETPLQHVARLRPTELPKQLRARLGTGGLPADLHETEVGRLSGGQKARLSMLLATIDAPHLLILDEPTNHLDIESREALVESLGAFPGAVILISHDPFLVDAVADTLWLVKDGRVRPYEADLDAYRMLMLTERGATARAPAAEGARKADRRSAAEQRRALAPLRAEVTRAEDRVQKIEAMLAEIDRRLSDPALYADPARAEALQIKRGEIVDGLERAEAIWMAAEEKLEAAQGA